MRHYTPANGSDEPAEQGGGRVPFGVQLLAVVAGIVIFVMGVESILQDYRAVRKITRLEESYVKMPARWLQVGVRADAGSSSKFYPDVLFEYFPDGKSVWGWRLSLEENPRSREHWEQRLAGYKAGDTVTAYVSPTDPKDSFVEPRTDGVFRYVLKGLVGVGFVVFGGLLVGIPTAGWLKKKKAN